MMRAPKSAAIVAAAAAAVWLVVVATGRPHTKEALPLPASTAMRIKGEAALARGHLTEARDTLEQVIEHYAGSESQLEQDEVSTARVQLGYLSAREGHYREAAARFEEAAAKHKGGQSVNADYGGLVDQAEYQAAVCKAKDAPAEKARELFLDFAKANPRSPLIHAALARIRRLGDVPPETMSAFDKLVHGQEEWLRRELALCGPKALAHSLAVLGKEPPEIERLAQLCGTDEQGTSMNSMRKALKALGLVGTGLRVNARDFAQMPPGTLWLVQGHYLVLDGIGPDRLTVYDPFSGKAEERPLPKTAEFTADVLVVRISPRESS